MMTPGAQAYPLDKRRLSGQACPGGPQVNIGWQDSGPWVEKRLRRQMKLLALGEDA